MSKHPRHGPGKQGRKLTDEQAEFIRQWYAKHPYSKYWVMAKRFNISTSTVGSIVRHNVYWS